MRSLGFHTRSLVFPVRAFRVSAALHEIAYRAIFRVPHAFVSVTQAFFRAGVARHLLTSSGVCSPAFVTVTQAFVVPHAFFKGSPCVPLGFLHKGQLNKGQLN